MSENLLHLKGKKEYYKQYQAHLKKQLEEQDSLFIEGSEYQRKYEKAAAEKKLLKKDLERLDARVKAIEAKDQRMKKDETDLQKRLIARIELERARQRDDFPRSPDLTDGDYLPDQLPKLCIKLRRSSR
jgi:chromosome segregation ATPase